MSGSMPSLHRSHIGALRDGTVMLAEVIRGKCVRARTKREAVMVLSDDIGFVYAGFATSPTLMLAALRHPGWLVGCYSMVNEHNRVCVPSVEQIAEDLDMRAREMRGLKAAA